MTHVPSWWEMTLLTLAVFRAVRFIGWDSITEQWRTKIIGKKRKKPSFMQKMISCAWCLGAHLSLGTFILWVWFPHATLIVATPLAISSAVGLIAKNLDP